MAALKARGRGWPAGEEGQRLAALLDGWLAELAELYAEPRVASIRIRASTRMSRSLARAYLDQGLVRIAAPMLASRHLREIVVHEVAHIVCHWQHGRVRPHGAEWRRLMRAGGVAARARLAADDVHLPPARRRRSVRRPARIRSLGDFVRSLL